MRPICEHFHLTELLDGIYGASRDNSRLDKDQVIRYCFDKIGFDAAAGDKAVMIGDRYTDIGRRPRLQSGRHWLPLGLRSGR